ncbi:hypothetical protein [Halorussus halophilus]|uniref:hypothetical protein n=1 Tax=Halorussus halophilus TaxID=2650975 RepID=UPI0013019ACA|nr:hypothetical protein [Halorussus halophilus]
MSSNNSKHVQTELSKDEYEQFREFAREHGLSLKEAGHEAVTEWIDRQQQANPNDRAFTVLDELEASSLPDTAETDAREEDDLVDEWDGSDETFTLADEPPMES